MLLEGLLDCDEVLQALGHLQPTDVEVTRVQKVVHPLLGAVERLGLSELVVVVWELEVTAPGMDVQPLP